MHYRQRENRPVRWTPLNEAERDLLRTRLEPFVDEPKSIEAAINELEKAIRVARRDERLGLFAPAPRKRTTERELDRLESAIATGSARIDEGLVSEETRARLLKNHHRKSFTLRDFSGSTAHRTKRRKAIREAREVLSEKRSVGRPREEVARRLSVDTGQVWTKFANRSLAHAHGGELGAFGELLKITFRIAGLTASPERFQRHTATELRES